MLLTVLSFWGQIVYNTSENASTLYQLSTADKIVHVTQFTVYHAST
jgi:hypothetical protein